MAKVLKDQPTTGLERLVWWTEFVIRHKGAKHLRSPVIDLPDCQYFLLDVIGFCALAILLIVYILLNLLKLIYNLRKFFVPKSELKA